MSSLQLLPANMDPFNILKLPLVAMRHAIIQMDIVDVFDWALALRKFRNALLKVPYKLCVENIIWRITNSELILEWRRKDYIVEYHCNGERALSNKGLNKIEVIRKFSIRYKKGEDRRFFVTLDDSENILEKLSRLLLLHLKCEKYHLDYKPPNQFPIRDLFLWKIIERFSSIEIALYSKSAILSKEELLFILEDTQSAYLFLNVCVDNFQYNSRLKKTHIEFKNVNWIDESTIMNMDSRFITSNCAKIWFDFNALLKNWISGGNENLQRMSFHNGSGWNYESTQLEVLFKDIAFSPSSFTEMEMRYARVVQFGTITRIHDIRRKKDNMLATVLSDERSFNLVVWKPLA